MSPGELLGSDRKEGQAVAWAHPREVSAGDIRAQREWTSCPRLTPLGPSRRKMPQQWLLRDNVRIRHHFQSDLLVILAVFNIQLFFWGFLFPIQHLEEPIKLGTRRICRVSSN